jgi:hypothetical protein
VPEGQVLDSGTFDTGGCQLSWNGWFDNRETANLSAIIKTQKEGTIPGLFETATEF